MKPKSNHHMSDYYWQKREDENKRYTDIWGERIKANRKLLRKKLSPPLFGSKKKKTHDMDEEMYGRISEMLQSQDTRDVEIAREIIFDSNIAPSCMDKLVNEHCETVLYGAVPASQPYVSGAYHTASYYDTRVTQ